MISLHKKILLDVALLGSLSGALRSDGGRRVKLSGGDILNGSMCPATLVKRFRGIPYAKPPTGSLRFMPPELTSSLSPHGGVFDASHAAAPCPQFNTKFAATDPKPSEDWQTSSNISVSAKVLTIVVYIPAHARDNSKLPVNVWAYGGFNEVGATSYPLYDAYNFSIDSIVVEFNYRVGPLGFLGLESAGIQENMAIKDAVAALKWVQTNVDKFGGDKSQVVLFGQSSGADDTFVIAAVPEARKLISAAITESGGGQFLTPFNVAQEVGASFAASLKCSKEDLPCLQSRALKDLNTAYQDIPAITNSKVPGSVLANTYAANIPKTPNMNSAILGGKFLREEPLKVGPQVPIMAGANQNDAALFTIPLFAESKSPITAQNYTDFISAWGPEIGPKVGKMYPLSTYNSTTSTSDAVVAAASHMITVSSYICPSYYVLEAAAAAGTDAYGYRFNQPPSCPWLQVPGFGAFPKPELRPTFGATHTSEIPFVFGNLDNMPFNNGTCNSRASEHALSGQLISSSTAMAECGSPATDSLNWPRYDACDQNCVFVQDKAEVTKLDFHECPFWGRIWRELAGEDLPHFGNDGREHFAC